MPAQRNIAVLIGSLRKASITRKTAKALIAAAPDSLRCTIVEIGDLPLYNEDLDENAPPSWTRFRSEIANADAILFVTPEYNRSIPGCLKNAIDVGSRPPNKSVWNGKPAGVVSVTPYKLGAFGANHAIRQTFVFLNMPAMQQPEAYIGGAADLFGDDGAVKNDETKKFLTKFMTAFAQWIATLQGPQSESFDDFMKRRETAAAAYVRGDAAPLDKMIPKEGDATFFPPNGGTVSGAADVAARYDKDAKAFGPGGTTSLEVLQSGASGNLAFWTGFQNARAELGGHTVDMKLRITELFRFAGGSWVMVHRHADPAAEPETKK
ncbi:MAG TPA: NAD(P)H-dependent oxidoreductase [Rhizomicrobium sp.]|jgi:NAD(P)H-dependent FMN reductase|nr:NAD(P)H-dependent oxidoreductase [Rhizomicrobium sp.]